MHKMTWGKKRHRAALSQSRGQVALVEESTRPSQVQQRYGMPYNADIDIRNRSCLICSPESRDGPPGGQNVLAKHLA